jgi:type I restriction enzyme S subunit
VKYPAYQNYKLSGVDWLGDVPDHWEVKRLKYSATINDEALHDNTDPGYELRYVDISSVDAVNGIVTEEEMVFETAPSRARRVVQDGDTIVSTVRTYLRAIAPIRNPSDNLIVSTGFAVVRPRSAVPTFLSYALRESSFVETVVARSVGVSYPAVNASEVATIPIALPPPAEQRAIAEFLDAETAKLDTLVVKKRKLIEKLKEKRSALISETVTRGLPPEAAGPAGLNPNPKLKPSGIEWLGNIPAHWEVSRLKFHLVKIEQGWSPQCENTPALAGEWGVLKVGAVNGWQFDPLQNKRLPDGEPVLLEYEIRVGDFLVSRANTRELLGSAALVRNVESRLILCDKLYRLKLNANELNSDFLLCFMRSIPGHFEFEREATGASDSMQNISQVAVKNLWLPIPPLSEQQVIATYLGQESSKIDRMVEKVEAAIERLQEYRAAVITAAVTGKIDLRGYVRATEAA